MLFATMDASHLVLSIDGIIEKESRILHKLATILHYITIHS